MKRDDFVKILSETVEETKWLFSRKNKSYGAEDDVFYNFRTTARRVIKGQYEDEHEDMLRVLCCYVDKHWVAICNRGLSDPEFSERCQDIINYMFIALALHSEWRGLDQEECFSCKHEDNCTGPCNFEPKEGC